MTLPGSSWGFLPYPFMLALAWLYIRYPPSATSSTSPTTSRTDPARGHLRDRALSAIVLVAVASADRFAGRPARPRTSDFLVASRTVGPASNAGAISGEYLSAASFLGIAGLILRDGVDALWYPVGFTAGYLALLLFVAAPLRRSGAYTCPTSPRPGCAPPRCARSAPRSSWSSVGCTCCRSCRAPG